MAKLSLVMIVKNEERCLQRCLECTKDIVDEIIIVDTGSTDRTKEIALSFTSKVYDFKWINDFAAARNYALDQSTGDWNLILDADEYIVKGSRKVFEDFMASNKAIGRVRIIHAFTRENGEIQFNREYTSRLAPKDVWYRGKIHEQLSSELPRKKIDIEINHDGYLYQDKSERNLSILYKELQVNPTNPYILYQIAHTLSVAKKHDEADSYFSKFYQYTGNHHLFKCRGVVDYLYHCIALKKFNTGLEIINKEAQNLPKYSDFHFVCGIFYMELVLSDVKKYIHYLPYIEKEYLTCLEIGENIQESGVEGTGSFGAMYNLGVWYEVSGNPEKAKRYYEMSAALGYETAKKRLQKI